jgi:hypothetical protein
MNTAETMSAQPWSKPQVYEIRFKGYLSPYRARMFEGLEMVQGPGGETVLTGPVIDQAALRDLGVPLLSVRQLSAEEASAGRDTGKLAPSSPGTNDGK